MSIRLVGDTAGFTTCDACKYWETWLAELWNNRAALRRLWGKYLAKLLAKQKAKAAKLPAKQKAKK